MNLFNVVKKNLSRLMVLVTAVSIAAGCSSLFIDDTNILGRHYLGALKSRKLDSLLLTMNKKYRGAFNETGKKKPYIFGNCVAHEVEKASPKNSYVSYADWTNFITDNADINVATFGVRSLIVSDGTFEKLNYNQDAAAFIIAHQIAHSLLDHTNEWLFKAEKPEGVSDILEAYVNNTSNFVEFAMAHNGSPVSLASAVPYSDEMEKEADTIAINMISYAGFNPSNAVIAMKSFIGNNETTYFRVHPMTENRFEDLMNRLPDTEKLQLQAQKHNNRPLCENL